MRTLLWTYINQIPYIQPSVCPYCVKEKYVNFFTFTIFAIAPILFIQKEKHINLSCKIYVHGRLNQTKEKHKLIWQYGLTQYRGDAEKHILQKRSFQKLIYYVQKEQVNKEVFISNSLVDENK